MIRFILWLAAHTLSRYQNACRYRRFRAGFGYRFLGFDWGQPK